MIIFMKCYNLVIKLSCNMLFSINMYICFNLLIVVWGFGIFFFRIYFRFEAVWDSFLYNFYLLNKVIVFGDRIYMTFLVYIEVGRLFFFKSKYLICVIYNFYKSMYRLYWICCIFLGGKLLIVCLYY